MKTDHRPHRITRPKAIVTAVVVTGFLVASCSSGGDSAKPAAGTPAATSAAPTATGSLAPAKKSGGACDIVSDDVVRDVLGVEIARREGKVTKQGTATGRTCIKGLARSNDPSGFTFVSAAVFDEAAGQGTALLDGAVSKMGGKSVPGLGDRAVFASSVGALFVIKGADVVQVQVTKAGKPGTLQDCSAAANDMLDRL